MSHRPPRRREILRDRKMILPMTRPARMAWSGKGGTFTLAPDGPAIRVADWSIETNDSQTTTEAN